MGDSVALVVSISSFATSGVARASPIRRTGVGSSRGLCLRELRDDMKKFPELSRRIS